jgi:hypothetical protein
LKAEQTDEVRKLNDSQRFALLTWRYVIKDLTTKSLKIRFLYKKHVTNNIANLEVCKKNIADMSTYPPGVEGKM